MPPKRKRIVKESEDEQPVAKKPRLTRKNSKKNEVQMEIEDQPVVKAVVTPKLKRGASKTKSIIEEKKDEEPIAITPTKPKLTRAATQIIMADPDDLWGNILPDEILFQIFTFLRRQELWTCKFVNNRWSQLTQDEALGWHLAASVLFIENLQSYAPGNPNVGIFAYITPGTPQEMELLAQRDTFLEKHSGTPVSFNTIVNNQYAWQQCYELLDKDDDVVGYARLHPKQNSSLNTLPSVVDLKDDKLWSVKITRTTVAQATEEKYQLWNISDTTRLWKVEIEINVRRFETLVRSEKRVPGETFIHVAMQDAFFLSVHELLESKGPYIPKKSLTAEKQPDGFKGIKLYKYQLDAISWMKSVENDLINNSISFCRAIPWRQARSDVMLYGNPQDYSGKREFVLPENVSSYVSKFKPRGGILADEMGLGKTMEVIGLILANPTDVDPDDVERDEPFQSRATLVLCPNHLAKQWQQEIEKVSDMKVALCSTINQLKAYSYDDFVNYDVIVFTYQLMQNPNYFYTGTTKSTYIKKRAAQTDRPAWVTNQLRAVHRAKDPMAKTCPLLEHFKWHRIVMDEAHEYITQEFYKCSYPFLHYNSLWYVTGTPFPNQQTISSLLDYIVDDPASLGIMPHMWHITPEIMPAVDVLLRTLYWRHTKESVKGEYEIPDCVEDLVLLEFSELEKIMYEGMDPVDEEYNRRLLCSFSQTVSLSAYAENMVNQKKNEIRWHTDSKAELERTIKQKTLDRKEALWANPAKAAFYEKEINNLNKEITKAENKIARFENMIAQLKDYPKYDKRKKEALKAIKKDSEKEEKEAQLDMIEYHGSKMASVVSFMRKLLKNPDNRAIVFSSFPQVLKNASELFNEHNIEHVFVEGNVWRKTKAITNFKKDTDVRVIILSLQSAASGTNLMEASHVILLDPVSGTKKEAQAVESQAIGRAYRQGQTKQVTVVRFIVKNTIEHVTYMRNNDVSNDTQVVTDKDNKPQLVKSSSFSVLVANKPSLQRSGSITNLLDGKLDQVDDMEESGNNTNVIKK